MGKIGDCMNKPKCGICGRETTKEEIIAIGASGTRYHIDCQEKVVELIEVSKNKKEFIYKLRQFVENVKG